jgi:NADH-quinone oxidoreductase subunit G
MTTLTGIFVKNAAPGDNMATVYVDGKPCQMNSDNNLLHECISAGLNLPYFCWHPALGSVGACRQCAVKQYKDEHDTHGKLVMACLTPVTEGARISINDPEAASFRAGVIEGLMLNHPHDCPVCDEGGECHLQDMTVMTGHDYRHYEFDKRTFRNQDLGPLVNHEMNRCIQCYRCVRYYREYAGGRDLNAFSLHNTVFFGRHEDGLLENEFSGNLVEICPTGVFTDKTLKRHYTRKWDQQFGPSICVHCGLGCNIDAGERYGILRRVVNRYHREINGYFLCDRGRYGYEFVNRTDRIRQPILNGRPITAESAIRHLRDAVAGGQAVGIGSPRASLESNFALRQLVGSDRFYSGVGDNQSHLVSLMRQLQGSIPRPTLQQVEQCDAVLVLGEDVTNTAPRLALALRQSVRRQPEEIAKALGIPLWMDNGVRDATQDRKGPLFIGALYATRLDDVATKTLRAAPDDLARFALDPDVVRALKNAQRPLVVSGAGCGSEAVIRAAAAVAASTGAALCFTAPECNSTGASLIGGAPLGEAFRSAPDTVIVLENDLYRRAPASEVDAFLDSAKHVIVLDHLPNRTTQRAELLLPAATFAESDGTLVNNEYRAQRFFQVFVPEGEIQPSWRWLRDGAWQHFDDVLFAMSASLPRLADARDAAPPATFRIAGAKVPRSPHRFSGRTAILANINVSEPKPPADPDSPLAFSMEGAPIHPPEELVPFFWEPGWNSIQSANFHPDTGGIRLRDGFEMQPQPPLESDAPNPFQPRKGQWFLVPIHHIFGSDELSANAQAVAELVPHRYVALNSTEFPESSQVRVSCPAGNIQLEVRIRSDIPQGVAGVFAPDLAPLPAWGSIERVA